MPSLTTNPPKILLVGWDGADWKIASPLIDLGELPQLAAIVNNGASGPLASLPPYLSPMLWNSIATGKYADQHGILGFTTTDPATGNLAAITSTQRKCKAVWNILSEHGLTAHVLGWFASHPAENVTGVCVTEAFPRPVAKGEPWPMPAGSVHPPELAEELAELRLRPEDVDSNILRLFIPKIAEIDLTADARPNQLAVRLAELYSVHNAAIAALDRGATDFLAVYYHFIDWVCHDFMDFHPPRRPQVSEREFEWYQDVVKSAYRLQDLLLRDLLSHAGSNVTVVLCSDHGFHSDVRRPVRIPMVSAGIALWHRAQGLFAAAGPGIARDALVPGATVLDITPTVLHLFGLPVGSDMDGQVLLAAMPPDSPPPREIPSYETVPGTHPRARHVAALSHADQAELLQQFAALGYVDLTQHGFESAARRNDRDNRWNLAITLRHAGKNEAALALLEELHCESPEDPRFAFHLASCQQHLGLLDEAMATAETIRDFSPDSAQAELLLAELATQRGDAPAALTHLDRTLAARARGGTESDPQPTIRDSALNVQRGAALLLQEKILEACAAFHAAIEVDRENPSAWLGYAHALSLAGRSDDAENCVREALALAPTMAAAHYFLGLVLAPVPAKRAEAGQSFARALDLNPRMSAAAQALDQLRGKPFVADILDVTKRTEETPPLELLRAAAVQRASTWHQRLAARRAKSQPLSRFAPSSRPPTNAAPADESKPSLVIVSGLPRSGTSLMMQMLARGGLPPMTDGQRAADANNPEGYFEWEEIKRLPQHPGIIARAAGHAVKVVSPLLSGLSGNFRYKIIFMTRPPAEMARSQHKMRSQVDAATPTATVMQPLLAKHADEILRSLRDARNVELLVVEYPELVAAPEVGCRRVAEFLGPALLPNPAAMAAGIKPELHRERASNQ